MSEKEQQGKLYSRKVSALHVKEALSHSVVNSWHEFVPIELLDEAKADFPIYREEPEFKKELQEWCLKWFGK
jgi:hypothetical protein